MDNSIEQGEQIEIHRRDTMPVWTVWQPIQSILNMINHAMILITSVYMTFLNYNTGNKAISWHAFLCTIGVRQKHTFCLKKID